MESRAEPDYRDATWRAGWQDFRTLVGFTVVVAVALGLDKVGESTARALAIDLRHVVDGVPGEFTNALMWLVLAGYLVLVTVSPIWLAVQRRFALLWRTVLGAAVGLLGYVATSRVAAVRDWPLVIAESARDVASIGRAPQAWEIAAFAAVTAVVVQALSPRWTRWVWTVLVLLALTRVVSTTAGPIEVLLAIGTGGMAGSLLLLVVGRSVSVLTPTGVTRLLAGCGLEVRDVEPVLSNGWAFRGTSDDGPVVVRVIDEREWERDRVRRGYRRLRLREVGDDEPFGSPVRVLTNEAMVGLLAKSRGVNAAPVLAVTAGAHGEAVLAVRPAEGPTLTELGEDLTDEVLGSAWQQVAGLADARIGVRALTTDHLVVTEDGVAVVDLSRAQPAAPDGVLAGDVAELLASTSAVVGPERAVQVAHQVLGHDRLSAALSRLVPVALTPATRSAVKASGGLAPVVAQVSAVTGVEEPEFEQIERMRPRTLVMVVMVGVAAYVLVPQLANLSSLREVIAGIDWRWVGPLVAASVATYIGAALGLAGGTPGRVPVGQAGAVALAASFVASFAPPGIGQVGLNVRFLQKRGFPVAVAASASGAKEAAVVIVHLSILTGFGIWAGSTDALSHELSRMPSPGVVAAVLGGMLSMAGLVLAVPRLRHLVTGRLVPALRASAGAMREVVTSPTKLVSLFGGVALLPLGYVFALYFAVRAFGVEPSFVAVGLVSLSAGALATAAPTPGGLGAVEAVLLASLTGLGIGSQEALASVMLYRLATFWLPIPPGAIAFRVLTAKDIL
ncbi:MAG: flippase-like domain-containing protein [Micrococcales bacterium]|nr:flippase-like domain-containing protein [Micrococcales bacterium]MCL2667941.1 flippase-like domain-containing protein [Micrococcales bacterium]